MSLLPAIELPVKFWNADKVYHLIGYGWLGFLPLFAFARGETARNAAYLMIPLGGLLEWGQSFVPGRAASMMDAVFNAVGDFGPAAQASCSDWVPPKVVRNSSRGSGNCLSMMRGMRSAQLMRAVRSWGAIQASASSGQPFGPFGRPQPCPIRAIGPTRKRFTFAGGQPITSAPRSPRPRREVAMKSKG